MFLQNTPILSDAILRVGTLGWYALPRWGKWHDDFSDSASVPPIGTSRSIRLVRPVGANGTMTFPIRRLRGVAWGPSVETGAIVPGYSGGVAACTVVLYPDLL